MRDGLQPLNVPEGLFRARYPSNTRTFALVWTRLLAVVQTAMMA